MGTSYYVTASVQGTSTTVAGAEDPNSTATEKGGVTISMYRIETFYFPAGTDFDLYATFSYTQPNPRPAGYDPLYGMLNAWAQGRGTFGPHLRRPRRTRLVVPGPLRKTATIGHGRSGSRLRRATVRRWED
jgi:hypothetical protein